MTNILPSIFLKSEQISLSGGHFSVALCSVESAHLLS